MALPGSIRKILVSPLEPGEIYRKCLEEISRKKISADYPLTETIAYAAETKYALNVLAEGHSGGWKNFADPSGNADAKLWKILDRVKNLSLAFVGSGPYPITAFLVRERYPQAKIACIDNHVIAYLLSQAIIKKLDLAIETIFDDAMEVDYRPYNVVLIAAMVSGKKMLIRKLLKDSEALILVRGKIFVSDRRLIQLESTFAEDGSFNG